MRRSTRSPTAADLAELLRGGILPALLVAGVALGLLRLLRRAELREDRPVRPGRNLQCHRRKRGNNTVGLPGTRFYQLSQAFARHLPVRGRREPDLVAGQGPRYRRGGLLHPTRVKSGRVIDLDKDPGAYGRVSRSMPAVRFGRRHRISVSQIRFRVQRDFFSAMPAPGSRSRRRPPCEPTSEAWLPARPLFIAASVVRVQACAGRRGFLPDSALVHRLSPGKIDRRSATPCTVRVSGRCR